MQVIGSMCSKRSEGACFGDALSCANFQQFSGLMTEFGVIFRLLMMLFWCFGDELIFGSLRRFIMNNLDFIELLLMINVESWK